MQKEQQNNLKKKMDDTIKSIKANSKDTHFADGLISDLLSYKGQLDHEPTLVHLPLKNIVDTFDGDTFSMNVMRDGTAVYHVKGGMDIVCKPNLYSLNETIKSFIEDSKRTKDMEEDERSAFDAELQAAAYVLNVPMFAFSDIDFMFDTASSVVKFLTTRFDEAMENELQDETPEENQQFEDAVMSMEQIHSDIEKENAIENND